MEVWARGMIISFLSVVILHIFVGAGGWERGNGSVGIRVWNYFLKIFFKNLFHPRIPMFYLFTLELKHGQGE